MCVNTSWNFLFFGLAHHHKFWQRILFYEAPISKEAIVRQISPKFHFDGDVDARCHMGTIYKHLLSSGDVEFSTKMQKYVPHVVAVGSNDACISSSSETLESVAKMEDYWTEEVQKLPSSSAALSSGLTQRKTGQ